jgi:hypothetical protein
MSFIFTVEVFEVVLGSNWLVDGGHGVIVWRKMSILFVSCQSSSSDIVCPGPHRSRLICRRPYKSWEVLGLLHI